MKRLVLCCDGTWNRADQERDGVPCPTNVVKLAYRVAKRDMDGVAQVIYYGHGVGTGNILDRYSGGAFGRGVQENIHDAYRFLIANYEAGDEIYLFGFSRGAFTARSIGGMIRNCGILKRESVAGYRDAIRLYHDSVRHPDHPDSIAFRVKHSVTGEENVQIRFVGVWDTVGALGIPLRGLRGLTQDDYQFHDTELSGSVKHAYHALAIDERRAPFEPTLWQYAPKEGQTVEQMWFPGVHSDVGGGYGETALSDLALEWMISKAQGSGLAFDQAVMKAHPIKGDPAGKMHDSMKGLYRITRGIDRPLGFTRAESGVVSLDPTQSLHDSVLERWDSDHTYRSPNVRNYLEAISDPRSGT